MDILLRQKIFSSPESNAFHMNLFSMNTGFSSRFFFLLLLFMLLFLLASCKPNVILSLRVLSNANAPQQECQICMFQ
jgi:hypothetical protein